MGSLRLFMLDNVSISTTEMIHINSTIKGQVQTNDLLLLQHFEQDLQGFAQQRLNLEEFRNLRLLMRLELDARHPNAHVHMIDNADFTLSGSYGLSQQIKKYIEHRDDVEVALQKFSLVIKLTFSEAQERPLSRQSKPKPTQEKRADDAPDFFPINARYNFDQIILPVALRDEIMSALNIIEHQDLIYERWGFKEVDPIPRSILNFHGAPGTGKTMCAHAIANHLHKPLLSLNYAEIESKFVGEAPKNLQKAFDVAREQDCVLFFDEADSFLGRRIHNVQQGADQALNSLRSQMLILLEEHQGVVIFATNLVSNFDPAFESRILKHLHFELPNQQTRTAILRKLLPPRLPIDHEFTDDELFQLNADTDGLSGREIKNAVLSMLTQNARPDAIFTLEMLGQTLTNAMHQKNQLHEAEQSKTEETARKLKERISEKLSEKLADQNQNLEK